MITPLRLGIVAIVIGVVAAILTTRQPPAPPEAPVTPATDVVATQPSLAAGSRQTLPSGLVIIDVAPGTGPAAKIGDYLSVTYTGRLYSNGAIFDSSDRRNGQPINFQIGMHQMIAGWEQGLIGMKVGEKRQLLIPPELAYGMRGTPDGSVPPAATLLFDVQLVKLTPPD